MRLRLASHLLKIGLFPLAVGAFGCDRATARDLKEWTPADHKNQKTPAAGQIDTKKARPGMPELAKEGITDVVLATWKTNCIRCHGTIGRGDGPDGRALRPQDLTNPAWQASVTDEGLMAVIKSGKDKMPAFGHLPDDTVKGLVALIRRLDASAGRPGSGPAKAPPSAAKPSLDTQGKAPAAEKASPNAPPNGSVDAKDKQPVPSQPSSPQSAASAPTKAPAPPQ